MTFECDIEWLIELFIVSTFSLGCIALGIYIKLCTIASRPEHTYWFAYCEGEKRNFIDKVRVTKFQYDNFILYENLPVRDITSNTIWFVVNDDTRNTFTNWQF